MGVSGSAPATPAAPRNKHLAHVSDPRSPSAGIPRTPIEVVSSPAGSPQPGPAEPAAGTSQDRDPRSPTPGISRTPMRAASSDGADRLMKQLSEAFGAEAAAPAPPGAACPAEEPAAEEGPARRSSPPAGGPEAAAPSGDGAERPPSPGAAPARPARLAGPGFPGSKPVRRKTNNKIMATPGGTGRSPLSILQDDNSPSAPAPRQGKRHVLGENLGEKKEVTVDLSRSLKSGNCAWRDLNKENQQCHFVEN
ncbi:cell division cycle-associated protein 3 [Gavia stellata]|uniref:cell division cycle-associated protein 3 n=1 Tax=Gavia stellata TaxID=37040 RepID=UPI002896B3B2|nr:cell division cycle-associated protein 3 [Gavia stellata]